MVLYFCLSDEEHCTCAGADPISAGPTDESRGGRLGADAPGALPEGEAEEEAEVAADDAQDLPEAEHVELGL